MGLFGAQLGSLHGGNHCLGPELTCLKQLGRKRPQGWFYGAQPEGNYNVLPPWKRNGHYVRVGR